MASDVKAAFDGKAASGAQVVNLTVYLSTTSIDLSLPPYSQLAAT